MTRSGTTVGTLSYMSPEQIKGQEIDGRSDLFSLGVILYQLLTGKMPFDGDNISTIVYKIVNEQPRRMAEINKGLPPGYDIVVHKALAKNPADRFQTCKALAASLENAEEMLEQTRALETPRETKIPTLKKKKKSPIVAAAALAGIAVVAGGIVLLSSKPEKSDRAGAKTAPIGAVGPAAKPEAESPLPGAPPQPEAKSEAAAPPPADLARLKQSFDAGRYEETAEIARSILANHPSDRVALDYAGRARREQLAAQASPILQAGIASFKQGDMAACVQEMEKVLAIDRGNAEAQRYLLQADNALSRKDILALIERHRKAEESKDLLVALSDVDSPALSSQWQGEYKLLFNGYDGISSSISGVDVTFAGRSEATARFSHLLTAVYKKDGKKKLVFEGTKTWKLRKKNMSWVLTGTE